MSNRDYAFCAHGIGDKVHIDDDKSIEAVVTGILIRRNATMSQHIQCECSWFASGGQQVQWIDDWRLSNA